MRFKHKPKPILYNGAVRDIKKFLWLPVTIGNETRWLERAEIRQQYRKHEGYALRGYIRSKWINISFTDNIIKEDHDDLPY